MNEATVHRNLLQTELDRDMQTEHIHAEQLAFNEMKDEHTKLFTTKKMFGKSSQEYKNVQSSLGQILVMAVSTRLAEEPAERITQIRNALELYQDALNSCDTYIRTHRRPFTISGKRRLRLVQQLKQNLERDRANIQIIASEGTALTSWTDILGAARCHTLDITGRTDLDHMGDFTSQLLVIGSGPSTVFFKETDVVMTREQEKEKFLGKSPISKRMQSIIAGIQDPQDAAMVTLTTNAMGLDSQKLTEDPEYFWNSSRRNTILDLITKPQYGMTAQDIVQLQGELHHFFAYCQMQFKGIIMDGTVKIAGIDVGNPLSCRNVATSRVVSLFGLNDTVAPSQMVVIKQKGEPDQYGTAMRKAEGKPIEKFPQEQLANATVSPQAVRQLSNLQVLDYICGQIDRHQGNFMLQSRETEDGSLHFTGITAFDNDMAFGKLHPDMIVQSDTKVAGKYNHLPLLTNESGLCSMPHIDEATYHTVITLDEAALRYMLCDLLDEGELNALGARLQAMKDVLQRTAAANPNFVLSADQWDANACREMAEQEGGYVSLVTNRIQVARITMNQ